MSAVLVSALHVLSLGVGLGAVFARGRALRAIAAGDSRAIAAVLFADNFWGLAAAMWIATGLIRVFAGIEKSADFYLFNGFFWVKMALFGLIFALEISPMMNFMRWRFERAKGVVPDTRAALRFARISDVETALVVVIPFVAAAMARGLWLIA